MLDSLALPSLTQRQRLTLLAFATTECIYAYKLGNDGTSRRSARESLTALQDMELVTSEVVPGDKIDRRVYRLTDAGSAALLAYQSAAVVYHDALTAA